MDTPDCEDSLNYKSHYRENVSSCRKVERSTLPSDRQRVIRHAASYERYEQENEGERHTFQNNQVDLLCYLER